VGTIKNDGTKVFVVFFLKSNFAIIKTVTGVLREEVIKVIKELNYRVDFPKRKKKLTA
jgi:hypothetical protein